MRTPSKPRTKAPEERRGEILAAARDLFKEAGFGATSVSDIVRRAGVAQGTFYLYFPSKDHVLAAVLEAVSAEYVAAMGEGLREAETPEAALDRALAATLAFFRDNHALLAAFQIRATQEELVRCNLDARRRLVEPLAGFIRQGMSRGALHTSDPDLAAHLMVGMVNDTLYGALVCGEPASPEAMLAAYKEFILKALAPAPDRA